MFEQFQYVLKLVRLWLHVTFFSGSNKRQILGIFSTASWYNTLSITIRLWVGWSAIKIQFLAVRRCSFHNDVPAVSRTNQPSNELVEGQAVGAWN